jgi:phosphogluconate dehydratase
VKGNVGRGVVKVSAVEEKHWLIEAPAMVFDDQEQLANSFAAGELNRDFIAVVRYQGPQACGMPELHKLTPYLGSLQDKGYKVALVTDGRMSGASGKVPAAIHLYPEAAAGGVIAKIRDGDMLKLDCRSSELSLLVDAQELSEREVAPLSEVKNQYGMGRELFGNLRNNVSHAELGASIAG